MEPGDFISSIYLYVSLVLVSGNCIFNPLNRFNTLSTNFFFVLFWSHVCFCYTTAVPLAFLAKKSERQKGFWRSCGQGSASRRIPSSTSPSPFSSSSFFKESSR